MEPHDDDRAAGASTSGTEASETGLTGSARLVESLTGVSDRDRDVASRRWDLSRRNYLAGTAAGLLGLAGATGSASAHAHTNTHASHGASCCGVAAAAAAASPEDFEIPEKGYVVDELGEGLYVVTEGVYQHVFMTTGEGVIVVDAPPTIGRNSLAAIREVTDEPITHVVYSHFHADHIGAASIYPDDAEYVAFTETAAFLDRFGDENRPSPTLVFGPRAVAPPGRSPDGAEGPGRGRRESDEERRERTFVPGTSYTLEVGDQRLVLDHRGPNHSPDNLYIHAPDQRVLMIVDVIFPGWVPFKDLAESTDIPGYVTAHDRILEYEFDTLVSGHLTRLGSREDVETQREFVCDLKRNTESAIATVELGSVFADGDVDPTNPWAVFDAYLDAVTRAATEPTLEEWAGRLRGAEVFTADHAATMLNSLRIDYGTLGPFGLPPAPADG
jgi:glyoxylase-like metal-dependent hydrolase (beta-lactamase superfamily II)